MGRYEPIPTENTNKKTVRIVAVSLETFTATGVNLNNGAVQISLTRSPSGIMVVPVAGEEWIVERHWDTWILDARTNFQNTLFSTPPLPGETRVGGTGQLTLQSDHIAMRSETSYEKQATLAAGAAGYVTYQVAPSGEVYCWGEVTFTAVSGTISNKDVATLTDLPEGVKVVPAFRRPFSANTIGSGGAGTALAFILPNGKIQFSATSSTNVTGLSFSTSWFIPQ